MDLEPPSRIFTWRGKLRTKGSVGKASWHVNTLPGRLPGERNYARKALLEEQAGLMALSTYLAGRRQCETERQVRTRYAEANW